MRLNPNMGPGDGDGDEGEALPQVPLYAGSLLAAHPALLEPTFKHSVVLLTVHSSAEGSLGVVINRPADQSLGEFDPKLVNSAMAEVPVYFGGPVATDQIILVAWKWAREDSSFKLYFGIDEAKALEIVDEDPGFELRAFLGHSGWGEGQLDAEIDDGSWVVSPLVSDIEYAEGECVWRTILSRISPEMRLLAEEPEDPSLN